MKRFLLSLTLAVTVLTSQGCFALLLGAAAGAGGVAYVKGSLEKSFDESMEQVHKASLAALKKLEAIVKQDIVEQHKIIIKAEDKQSKDLTIEIEALTEKASKIRIRYGVFGDQEKSQLILNAIQNKL